MVVDLAVVAVGVVACLRLSFDIGVATALGVHVVVASLSSFDPPSLLPCFLPSSFLVSLLSSFLPSFLPSFPPSFLLSFLPSFLLPCFLPSFLPCFLAFFLPSFLPRKWHGIHPRCKEHDVFLGKQRKCTRPPPPNKKK